MDGLLFVLWALAAFLALAAAGYLVSLFNSLVQVKNNIGKAWHNLDVLLQQRNEELPKLADAVRAYVGYENTVLPRLVELRARYLRARDSAAQTKVENEMEAGLGRLAALWEGHPDLMANATFLHLQGRISALEDAIADRRVFFNDTVTIYNTQIGVFPQLLIARLLRWRPHPLLESHRAKKSVLRSRSWWAGCLAAVAGLLLLLGCSHRNDGILRPSEDYYGKFPGQWTSSHWAGGDGWEKHWALSFGRNYSVFIKTPEGRVYRGAAEMRFDLGAASDGQVRMPPGSTLLDVRIDEGPDPGHKWRYLLGAFSKVSERRNMHGKSLSGCLGEPGGRVRATSFKEPVAGVRCFELFKAGDDVAAEIEKMAGERARDGRWHVSKSRTGDIGIHLGAHVENMFLFLQTCVFLILALFVVALIRWKFSGRELREPITELMTGKMPMAVMVFPYVGPRMRAGLWRALLFFMLLMLLPVPLFLSPGIVLVVIVAHVMTRLAGKLGLAEKSGDQIPLVQKLRGLALAIAVSVGMLAPLCLIYVLAYNALGQPPNGALYDLVATPYARSVNRWVALAGAGVVALLIAVDAFWRLRQAKTVSNLATSTAASVSHGLVELAGYAQPARGVPADEPNLLRCTQTTTVEIDWRIAPFDLEDASGRIRIDPRGAKFNPGWIGDLLHVFTGFHEMALNGRVVVDEKGDSITRTLEAGDPVYVIGHVRRQRDEATGEEMHVVSPFGTALESPFRRLFGGAQSAQNIFFLSDSGEEQAKEHLLRGFRRVWFVGLAWLAASVFLYWSAS